MSFISDMLDKDLLDSDLLTPRSLEHGGSGAENAKRMDKDREWLLQVEALFHPPAPLATCVAGLTPSRFDRYTVGVCGRAAGLNGTPSNVVGGGGRSLWHEGCKKEGGGGRGGFLLRAVGRGGVCMR